MPASKHCAARLVLTSSDATSGTMVRLMVVGCIESDSSLVDGSGHHFIQQGRGSLTTNAYGLQLMSMLCSSINVENL